MQNAKYIINAGRAYAHGYSGSGVNVCVLDTGVFDHKMLDGRIDFDASAEASVVFGREEEMSDAGFCRDVLSGTAKQFKFGGGGEVGDVEVRTGLFC